MSGSIWISDPAAERPPLISATRGDVAALPALTVLEVFADTVKKNPRRLALRVKRNNAWQEWSYTAYLADVKRFACSLIAAGLGAHECISIIGFNAPEWFIADMGAVFAGGIAAGIYSTNGPDACHYIADHSRSRVVVVEDDDQLQKMLSIRARLPHLRAIVMYTGGVPAGVRSGSGSGADCAVYDWAAFMRLGEGPALAAQLQQRMAAQRPGHVCTLIYTSGTTGNPKAVMLTHDNLTWTSRATREMLSLRPNERCVSYLPLSHIAAQMTDLHVPLLIAGTVSFARPDALKGTLVDTLTEVKPTVLLGVPRVWEKIEERMRAVGAANTGLKKMIGDWAKGIGLRGHRSLLQGGSVPWGWSVADLVVFANVKKALGLEECRLRVTGAAPISVGTLEYFMSLDMPLLELYGMSECCGPHTLNIAGATRVGTVGRDLVGVETRIDRPSAAGEGEICMRGRHVFAGYMHNPEATRKTFDDEGWLHTGDLGKVDSGGFLSITGRIKELIITAGGENVPPVLVENLIKAECDALSNVVVIGDKRKYLSALITLKSEPDANGQPTQTLAGPALALVKRAGSPATTTAAAAACPRVRAAVQAAIDKANANSTSKAQRVNAFTLLAGDFTQAGGELTPTMKLKRRVVSEKYAADIEAMYGPAAAAAAASAATTGQRSKL